MFLAIILWIQQHWHTFSSCESAETDTGSLTWYVMKILISLNYADKFVQHKAVRKQPNSMKARRIYVQKGQPGSVRVLFTAVIELTRCVIVVVFEDKCGFE